MRWCRPISLSPLERIEFPASQAPAAAAKSSPPTGVKLVENWLSAQQEKELVKYLEQQPWSDALQRRTQHYGFLYDYQRRRITGETSPFTGPVRQLAEALRDQGLLAAPLDRLQCIVNEYQPGQGISAHVDHETHFGEQVVSISLLSNATMVFKRGADVYHQPLPRRSLVRLEGEARHSWTHEIPPVRSRRLSLTYRSLK